MFAKALAGPLSRMGLHYGWVVVAVTFLVALTTAGAVGVPSACHRLAHGQAGANAKHSPDKAR